jgi:hypothetical protein
MEKNEYGSKVKNAGNFQDFCFPHFQDKTLPAL